MHMKQSLSLAALALLFGGLSFAPAASAQVKTGEKQVFQVGLFEENISGNTRNISFGDLVYLQADPHFDGDFDIVYNEAKTILNGYTVVTRRGLFPENRGVPVEQQLLRTEAIHVTFQLSNGTELLLYRTPSRNTSSYLIRRPEN